MSAHTASHLGPLDVFVVTVSTSPRQTLDTPYVAIAWVFYIYVSTVDATIIHHCLAEDGSERCERSVCSLHLYSALAKYWYKVSI